MEGAPRRHSALLRGVLCLAVLAALLVVAARLGSGGTGFPGPHAGGHAPAVVTADAAAVTNQGPNRGLAVVVVTVGAVALACGLRRPRRRPGGRRRIAGLPAVGHRDRAPPASAPAN